MSLVFYDTETTGTETFFDQILQFAAIKTDADFNEIDRFEVRCRLLPHVVPAPGAMRVTGVRPHQLNDPAIPSHYEMIRQVRAKFLEWSPAIFVGYNSLDFDEDLLRQALYKTLHNPYLTNRDGNSRSDVMRMVQACSLFAPGVLTIPVGEKGKPTFKLDRVAPANGFKHDKAHDAMGDVEATIHMCRLITDKAPEVWSAFMRFSQKAAVVDYITDEPLFCLTEFYYGKPFSYLVAVIGQNQDNKNEWYVYDLSIHPESVQAMTDEQLSARLGKSPKPLRRLRSNSAPILFPADQAPEICKGRECGMHELGKRAAALKGDKKLCERLIGLFEASKEEYPPSPHVEKQIYDGFFKPDDEKLMDGFHETDWPNRVAIVEKFQDPRLKAIGRQLIHIERPDLLGIAIRREHHLAASRRLLGEGEEIGWMTLPQALAELKEMLDAATDQELELLREYDAYLQDRANQAKKVAGGG